jgi:hypothetical protein
MILQSAGAVCHHDVLAGTVQGNVVAVDKVEVEAGAAKTAPQ